MNDGKARCCTTERQERCSATTKELEGVGLAAPQVTYVVHTLKASRDWDVDERRYDGGRGPRDAILNVLRDEVKTHDQRHYAGTVLPGEIPRLHKLDPQREARRQPCVFLISPVFVADAWAGYAGGSGCFWRR